MFGAQLVGQLVGALLTPMAFMLFYRTGQVNVPGGPYPAPFADIYRGGWAVMCVHVTCVHVTCVHVMCER